MQTTGTHIATLSYPKAESKNIFSCSHQIEQMWKFSKPGHEIAECPAGSHLMRKYHLHIYMVAVPKRNISYSQCCMMPEVHWLIKQILHSSPQKKYSSVPILNIFLVNQNKSCLLLYSSTALNYRLACDFQMQWLQNSTTNLNNFLHWWVKDDSLVLTGLSATPTYSWPKYFPIKQLKHKCERCWIGFRNITLNF